MAELSPLLEHLVDTGFKVAESQFQEGKAVLPQVTLLSEDEEGMVVVPILSTVDIFKGPKLPGYIQGIWRKLLKERSSLKLLAIALMMDTWVENISAAELAKRMAGQAFVPPSQKADSQEAILVQLTLPNEDIVYEWRYVRIGKEVIFVGKPEEMKKGAVFPGLWPV